MRRHLLVWELAGVVFTVMAGALLHFVYEWSGGSPLAAAFSAVNESTWEHMNLLFFPMFLFSAVQAVRAVSTLVGVILIPVLFYTYTGVLGYHVVWADIAVFALAALTAFMLDFRLLRRGRFADGWQQVLGLIVLWGLAVAFVYCTFRPPQLALWQDPITMTRGIP